MELVNSVAKLLPFNDPIAPNSWGEHALIQSCSQEELIAATALAYRNLFKFRKEFEKRTFQSKDQAAIEISINWDPSFLPNFHYVDGHLTSNQREYFGTLALGEALSEFLIGVECLGAYEILEKKDYDPLASFIGYTSSFHLIDSFLSLHGIFYVPFPIQELQWNTFRRTRDERARGARIERLEAKRLRSLNSEPISCVVATLDPSVNTWEFSVIARRSAHKLKWAAYGDLVIQLIKEGGVGAIPREIADFFGYFA